MPFSLVLPLPAREPLIMKGAGMTWSTEELAGADLGDEKKPPAAPPTIRGVIRQFSMFGGCLGRKGDGEPGMKTLRLSFAHVRDSVEDFEHMRQLQNLDGCV